jgi:hypothetical protein
LLAMGQQQGAGDDPSPVEQLRGRPDWTPPPCCPSQTRPPGCAPLREA